MAGARANEIALLERFAGNEGELGAIEAERARLLAEVNAEADRLAGPLLAEQARLRARIEAWWAKAADRLCPPGRKSIELGGCMIGTRSGRPSLEVTGDELVLVAALAGKSWGKALVRVRTSLDRGAALKALDGPHGEKLAALGVSRLAGEECFFVARVDQPGALTGA